MERKRGKKGARERKSVVHRHLRDSNFKRTSRNRPCALAFTSLSLSFSISAAAAASRAPPSFFSNPTDRRAGIAPARYRRQSKSAALFVFSSTYELASAFSFVHAGGLVRWGRRIFEGNKYKKYWDNNKGKCGGQPFEQLYRLGIIFYCTFSCERNEEFMMECRLCELIDEERE